MIDKLRAWFELAVVGVLMVLMAAAIAFALVDVVVTIVDDLRADGILDVEELLDTFGLFLIVLIGLELFETVKSYFREHIVHVECIFMVAMIAVARKVIMLEYTKTEPLAFAGIAALVFALAAGYYLIKRANDPARAGAKEVAR